MTYLLKEILQLRLSLLLLLFTVSHINVVESACQSCLLPVLTHRHHQSRWGGVTSVSTTNPRLAMVTTASSMVVLRNLRKPFVQRSIVVAVAGLVTMTILRTTSESSDDNDPSDQGRIDTGDQDDASSDGKKQRLPLTNAMVATIGVYKNFISPLLPPACRFLPTCSQYGVQAIEQFGPTKGAILTAWRLLRCSPFGGKGYDPPRWPPVKYTYGSY